MNRRNEILAAAAEVFAQHGFRGSTTRRIADAAGVNEITLFRQFGSKEALLREAMQHMTQSISRTPLPDPPVDPDRELTEWSESFIQHLRLRSSIIRKMMSEIEERPEMRECASDVPSHASDELCRYLVALRRRSASPKRAVVRDSGRLISILKLALFGPPHTELQARRQSLEIQSILIVRENKTHHSPSEKADLLCRG